jgi:sugar phosphate isomerase/epimerase
MANKRNGFKPRLAMCNLFDDIFELKEFALDNGFDGIDWSFDLETIPASPGEETKWITDMKSLYPLEIRYHCPFRRLDLGHDDLILTKRAHTLLRRIIRLVARTGGQYLTIHIGLGHDTTEPLSWDTTVENLASLVQYGRERRVTVCLENLSWGWTSRPHLFEKLIRKSGAAVTFDIGHAHRCESVQSLHFAIDDFITPHQDRIVNAHIYHTEVIDRGHIAPDRVDDIADRLDLLKNVDCRWWVIEMRDRDSLLQTAKIIRQYLA